MEELFNCPELFGQLLPWIVCISGIILKEVLQVMKNTVQRLTAHLNKIADKILVMRLSKMDISDLVEFYDKASQIKVLAEQVLALKRSQILGDPSVGKEEIGDEQIYEAGPTPRSGL